MTVVVMSNAQEEGSSYQSSNTQLIFVSPPIQYWPVCVSNATSYLNFSKNIIRQRKLLPKGQLPPFPRERRKRNFTKRRITENSQVNSTNNNLINFPAPNQILKMLPDMPSLGGTPMKNQTSQSEPNRVQDNNTGNTETVHQNLSFQDIGKFEIRFEKPESSRRSEGADKDNPDDINELMKASSTVKNVTKKEPSGAEKKRAKVRREFLANLVMATPDDLETENQKEDDFVDAFFDKLRLTLTKDDYNRFIDILAHYDESNGNFLDLYKSVQSVLFPLYIELAEEFLLFLSEIQAHKVNKLMPYFVMKDMDRFIKKLQVYFKDQPAQLRKIIKCLTDLSENADITMDNIKSDLLPLFKGNAALTDWFLQLFPCERPPNLLTSGPHEVIDISKELARQPDEDICETVTLPDTEDPYGGASCICTCHGVENPQFKSRSMHCKQCGLKFIQGKIYIQSGKSLRPAVVSFLTNPEKDHTKRLSATQRKRSDTSPSKQVTSPTKENQTHEASHETHESDDDCDGSKKKNRQSKTKRKRKVKHRDKPTKDPKLASKETKAGDQTKTDGAKAKTSPKRQTKKRNPVAKKPSEHKPGSKAGQQKRPAEQEIEYSEPAELVELKVSSDHSGESESEECFVSSQDATNTDSEVTSESNLSPVQQSETKQTTWTREEDKIILQAFKQRRDNEEPFKHISELLPNRSVVEIKNRFHTLMSLLQQMATKTK